MKIVKPSKEEQQMTTEKKVEPQVETKMEVLVVDKLPEQPVRNFIGENGIEYHLFTRDEALTEILEAVRVIKKSVA